MSQIDIPTLLLAMTLVGLSLGVCIGLVAKGSEMRPLRFWSAAMLFDSFSYLLLALRGHIPDIFSIVLANVTMATAFSLTIFAVALYTRTNMPRWLLWAPVLLAGVLFALFIEQQRIRFIISGALYLAQTLPIIAMLQRHRESKGPGRMLLIGTLSLMAFTFLLQIVIYGFDLAPSQNIHAPTANQVLTYLLVIITLLLSSLGFLFMVKERADRALLASEEHFRAFFERSMVGMATVAPDRRWIEVNKAFCQMTGYSHEEMMRTTWSDLTHPDNFAVSNVQYERVIAGEIDEFELEKNYVRKDGSVLCAHLATRALRRTSGKIDYFVVLIEDITERKANEVERVRRLDELTVLNRKLESAQNQLLQSEKLASIGQLAAGVAHEINNPIGFVKSNLSTLTEYIDDLLRVLDASQPSSEAKKIMEEVDFTVLRDDLPCLLAESREGIERVSKIVRDLKDFSRVGESEWQWADLHQCVDSTLNIAANELKYKCTVTRQFGILPEVYCVPSQLNQVFMNVLVNAAQAIEDKGEIVIITEQTDEHSVSIRISDTGAGIPQEIISRIFDPFFTTKPVGKGTGLGLSLSWSIIKKHHGHIEVESKPGKGTTFSITLPIKPVVVETDSVTNA